MNAGENRRKGGKGRHGNALMRRAGWVRSNRRPGMGWVEKGVPPKPECSIMGGRALGGNPICCSSQLRRRRELGEGQARICHLCSQQRITILLSLYLQGLLVSQFGQLGPPSRAASEPRFDSTRGPPQLERFERGPGGET
jgi:hypothetical protein